MDMLDYISCSGERIKGIINSPRFRLIFLIEFIPRKLRRYKIVERIIHKFLDIHINKHLAVHDTKFVPVDRESLTIISPKHEEEMKNYFRVKKGEVFIDVGAHVGKYTFRAARDVGSEGLVIAFEPFPKNFQALLEGMKINQFDNVLPYKAACWNEDVELDFNVGDVCGHGSIKGISRQDFGSIKVKCVKIDDVIHTLGIQRIDLMKIDTEGSEYEVLDGSEMVLRRFKPRIICEVSHINKQRVLSFMQEIGYSKKKVSSGEVNDYFFFK